MSLVTQINSLITRIGTEFKTTKTLIAGNSAGDLSSLSTTAKNNLVSAINELKTGYTALNGAVSKNKGYFASSEALTSAYPAASAGDYAINGATDTVWVWDADAGTPAWKDGGGAGTVTSVNGQTGAVVISEVTTSVDGLMVAADKVKLNSIAASATANDSDANLKNRANHTGTQTASTISDFASSVIAAILSGLSTASNSVVLATDSIVSAIGKLQAQITSHMGSGGTSHESAVANSTSGFMTGADKAKLDGVATSATANDTDSNLKNRANHTGSQVAATISDFASSVIASALSGLSVASALAISAADSIVIALGKLQAQITAHAGSGGATHATVVPSGANGFMSGADKAKLDGLANFSHPTGDGNLHVPATGTGNNTKVLKAGATAGSAAWGTVDFSELGSKPTTIGGYSISDAYTKTEIGDPTTDFVAAFNLVIA